MKIFVYNYNEGESDFFDLYARQYGVELGICREYPSLENAELARGYDGITHYVSDMNAALLERFHSIGVKYITSRSVGYDHFDLEKARELGLKISTVAYSPNSVANYTIMLMLMACRKIKYIMDRHSAQDFSLAGKRGREISRSTVGIVGTGKIGKTVVEHLSGFGCEILVHDLHRNSDLCKYATYVELETLLQRSDIVSFHMPSTPENDHLLNDESLSKMKDGVIVVNTARGSLIDTDALIRGLESGKVGGAALDVLENEFGLYYHDLHGKVIENRDLAILKSFPNVILTPHTAFYTDEAVGDMVENAVRGCCLFAEGKPNPFEVV